MTSYEMETYPFGRDAQPLVDHEPTTEVSEEKVQTGFGKVKVTIYGDKKRHPIVTFHDLGLDSESNFQNFFQFSSVAEFTEKFCVYNINAPGQEIDAAPLPDNYVYPTMDGLAKIVEAVTDHFELRSFVGFGVGMGANVMLRYALVHQHRLDSLILVNCVHTPAGWIEWAYQKMNMSYLRKTGMTSFTVDYLMWHHFGRRLDECAADIVRQYRVFFQHLPNATNLASLIESYVNRSPIHISRDDTDGPKLNVPVLQIVGAGSAFVNDSVEVNTRLDPSKTEWIKISDACGLVLDDRPEAVTQALVLFLQGLGFFPSMNVVDLIKKIELTQNGQQYSSETRSVNEC